MTDAPQAKTETLIEVRGLLSQFGERTLPPSDRQPGAITTIFGMQRKKAMS